jgi:radical SAM family uncharacterized protein/radical SAM-linked protein
VKKPARYVGGEHGEVVKRWDAVDARMALAFPDTYEIGMSHLGYKILYSILARHPRLLAERVYAPWADMEAELRRCGLPLVSLESARPLSDFDVVGFSLQFELTYTNVLMMLDLGGIPLRSAARTEAHPLVIAGGPTATHPEALAPFIDAFVIGDGEEKLPELLLTNAAGVEGGLPRAERLRRWAGLGGVYVPALYETAIDPRCDLEVVARPIAEGVPARAARAFVSDLSRFPFPSDGPVPTVETVFDRASIEIARGCTEGCRFCQAGMIYRPVRERDPLAILDAVKGSIREGGYDDVSLTSLSTADQSCIAPLVARVTEDLEKDNVSLGVSSLRAYGLGEDVLEDLARMRATGLTFAPEAGSQRMRDVINKNVTEEQLLETAERVFSRGWQKMKLYFMIGLPTETDEDVAAIVETAARTIAVGRRVTGRKPTVTCSVSTHVPKPHTPFQWAAIDPLAEIERKQELLRDLARRRGVDLKLHDPRGSILEGLLARGDRRVAAVVERAYELGCRFDSWDEHLRFDLWQQAVEETGVDPARYLGTLPVDAKLPWDHLDVGLEDGFLAKEYRKALKNRLSPPCGKPVGAFVHATNLGDALADVRKLVCYDCGVLCDMEAMRQERIDYLAALGAQEKRPIPPRPERLARSERPKPRALSLKETPSVRLRLRYEKTGLFALTSHLDLVRTIPRVFRRAGVALAYSRGFHPKPILALSPALPLGITSLGEVLDIAIVLGDPVEPGALCEELTKASPQGLRFVEARVLGPTDAAVGRVLRASRWLVAFPSAEVAAEALAARVEALLASTTAEVDREREHETTRLDVRPFVELAGVAPSDRAAVAGVAGDESVLELRLAVVGSGGARPVDVAHWLVGNDVPARIVRLGFDAEGRDGRRVDPLDLEALRAARSEPVKDGPAALAD